MANCGYEALGGTWWSLVPNKVVAMRVTLPVSGTVTSITAIQRQGLGVAVDSIRPL